MKNNNANIQQEWQEVTSQWQVWVFPVLVAVVIIGSLVGVLLPQLQAIFDTRDELSQEKEQLARLTDKRQALESMSEATLNSELALAEKALPSKKPIFTLIESIGQEFEAQGLTMTGYDFSPGKVASESESGNDVTQESSSEKETDQPGKLSKMTIEVEATGPIEAAEAFLKRLESLSPLSSMQQLEVSADPMTWLTMMQAETMPLGMVSDMKVSGTPDDTTNASIKGELVLYYSLPPETIGKPSDPLPPKTSNNTEVMGLLQQLTPYTNTNESVTLPQGVDYQREDLFNF